MGTGRTRWEIAWLMGCILLAVLLRCSTYHDLLTDDGRLLFLDPDSYDHLRRITLGLVSFPHIPVFDAYYGYPVGTGQVWSPFFDYLITAILFLATAGHGGAVAAESFGFWLSPLLAVGNVLAIYYLATRLLDRTAGLAAALVIAILPAHLMYSFAGLLDHHAAEPLLCLFLLHSLLAANEVGPATKSWHRGLATGALLVCSLLIWRGSVIFWGMAMVILFIQARCEVSAGNALSPAGQYGLRACLWAVLLLLPVCLFDFWGGAATISFARISWFHVILLVACAAALGMASRLSRLRSLVLLAAVVAGLALIASATGLSQFVSQFRAGLVVIFGNDPWLNTIDELRSILFPDGQFSLWYGAGFLSGLYYLCPFVLLSIVRDWLQHGRRELSDVVLLVLVSAFFVLPLFRERYMHLGGVAVAVCTGYLVSRLRYRFTSHMRHRPGCWAAGLSLVVLFLPIVPFLSDPGREVRLTSEEKHDLREALHWLKTRTPPTAGYLDPRQIPEYGVLADWSLGSLITYVAQRPAMATNFGWETHGLYESASFLALSNPAAAEMIVRNNRVRYILLSDLSPRLHELWSIAEHGVKQGRLPFPVMPPFDLAQSMFARLYFANGTAEHLPGAPDAALERFRLVYASPHYRQDPVRGAVSSYKIFEHVPGALVSGIAGPGSRVDIRLVLQEPQGGQLVYSDATRAGRDGGYSFHVPYATDSSSGDFSPTGAYEVNVGGKTLMLQVTERAVQTGGAVSVQ